MNFAELRELTFFENTLLQWTLAATVAVGMVVLLNLLRRLATGRLAQSAKRTVTRYDDGIVTVLSRTRQWFVLTLAIWLGTLVLDLPETWSDVLWKIMAIVLFAQIGIWAGAAVVWALEERYAGPDVDPAHRTGLTLLRLMALLVVWSAVVLLALSNVGVDVTALVAGLGVGGIAIALAVQNILSDLFASVSIVLDKPFVVGEFIIVGSEMGTVDNIGLKTTRIRSLGGEQISFANADLLSSRIRNYTRMEQRRVVFSIGVVYETPREKLTLIPQIIREAVEAQEKVRFDRCHFAAYGDFSLNFETVYIVLDRDYNVHMDILQQVNLRIFDRFAEEEIEFAYPTQKLYTPDVSRPDEAPRRGGFSLGAPPAPPR